MTEAPHETDATQERPCRRTDRVRVSRMNTEAPHETDARQERPCWRTDRVRVSRMSTEDHTKRTRRRSGRAGGPIGCRCPA